MPKLVGPVFPLELKRIRNTYGVSLRCARLILKKEQESSSANSDPPAVILNTLQKWRLDVEQVANYPQILKGYRIALDHRRHCLQECGIDVQVATLAKYLRISRTSVWALEESGLLPPQGDLVAGLCDSAAVAGAERIRSSLGELATKTLMDVRLAVFGELLQQRLHCSAQAAHIMLEKYPRNRHKSLRLTARAIELFHQNGIDSEKIVRNPYLLNTHPESLESLFANCPSVANTDIRDLIRLVPRIAYVPWHNITQMASLLREYGFEDEAVAKCPELFSLSPATVRKRLEATAQIQELWALRFNPYFLRLLYSYQRTERRLEHLRSVNMRCGGVGLLMGRLAQFRRFVSTGDDRSSGNLDTAAHVGRVLQLDKRTARRQLALHPFWRSVPLTTVEETLRRLLAAGYSRQQCRHGLHLLLYPAPRALAAAELAADDASVPELYRLQLAVYLLEREGHFSGAAVFDEAAQQLPHAAPASSDAAGGPPRAADAAESCGDAETPEEAAARAHDRAQRLDRAVTRLLKLP